jgi:hypothetical protein
MSDFYSEDHRSVQDRYGTRPLADRLESMIVHSSFTEADIAFIQSREFFFLSTVDASGHPTVSFKGGNPGFVTVQGDELVIPCYDGNGMFLSVGNIAAIPMVGSAVHRLREALEAARPRPRPSRRRCGRSMGAWCRAPHPHRTEADLRQLSALHSAIRKNRSSKFNPDAQGKAPLPDWKRLKEVHDVLRPEDQQAAATEGLMSMEEAVAKTEQRDNYPGGPRALARRILLRRALHHNRRRTHLVLRYRSRPPCAHSGH